MAEARPHKLAAIDLHGLDTLVADSIIVFVAEDGQALTGVAGLVDWRCGGLIGQAHAQGHFRAGRGEPLLLPAPARLRHLAIIAMGLGPLANVDDGALMEAAHRALAVAHGAGCRRAAVAVPELTGAKAAVDAASLLLDIARAAPAAARASHADFAHIIVKVLALKVD